MVVCGISIGHEKNKAARGLMPRVDIEAFSSFAGFD
jgi:hypothetical protein